MTTTIFPRFFLFSVFRVSFLLPLRQSTPYRTHSNAKKKIADEKNEIATAAKMNTRGMQKKQKSFVQKRRKEYVCIFVVVEKRWPKASSYSGQNGGAARWSNHHK
ncbi:hypothetical protein OUZ56_028592 [Daphnia magna]|uniref:Secreted protein n=1 Tax=Daphnia magna TaxID=35525 RepID=A0ABR0B4W8_9CRUS|nr:hypothetical protein OUZ56_028592 [Daphnia magna]